MMATTAGGGLAGIMPSKNALGALMALGIILWLLNVFESKKHRAIPIFMTLVCLFTLFQAKVSGGLLNSYYFNDGDFIGVVTKTL